MCKIKAYLRGIEAHLRGLAQKVAERNLDQNYLSGEEGWLAPASNSQIGLRKGKSGGKTALPNLREYAGPISAKDFLCKAHLPGIQAYLGGVKAYLRGVKAFLRGVKAFLRGVKAFLRGDKAYLRGVKAYLRRDKAYLRGDKVYLRGVKA